jgi:electron transport complex protein RnfB
VPLPRNPTQPLAAALDALLPQTQCGLCGYAGCLPYAEAMAGGTADINRCPPGGDVVIEDLARALGCTPKPLDTRCGITQPPAVAVIDEAWCIGCTLCIQACPVDAIAGAAKVMHTVIAAHCTGCELCIPPCPVDCIQMVAVARPGDRPTRMAYADQSRRRDRARTETPQPALHDIATAQVSRKQAAVQRALKRAQDRIDGIKNSL